MNFAFTNSSGNKKTGPIPVVTVSSDSCPPSCPLMNYGCYAQHGPIAIHWARLDRGECGLSWECLLEKIRSLPPFQFWRYAQAGDLPGLGGHINIRMLQELVQANRGRKGFAYTHKPVRSGKHRRAISEANRNGFTINLSADNLAEADRLSELKIGPVIALVMLGSPNVLKTPAGRKVVVCPTQTQKSVTCQKCRVCAEANRKHIVGFLPHGTRKNKANELAKRFLNLGP